MVALNRLNDRNVLVSIVAKMESFAASLQPKGGRPTAFVCTGTACKPPAHEPSEVAGHLR